MFSYALRIRPRLAERRGRLPLAILLAAMASVFALGGDRGVFYQGDTHGEASARTLAIAELLSPAHGFRLTRSVWRDADGGFEYDPYSRFPIGGYALIKLATLPFGSDLAAKLLAALVFALSVLLAGQAGRGVDQTEREKTMLADFNAIADIIKGKRVPPVSRPQEWGDDRGFRRHPPYYYLSGSYWRTAYDCADENDWGVLTQ